MEATIFEGTLLVPVLGHNGGTLVLSVTCRGGSHRRLALPEGLQPPFDDDYYVDDSDGSASHNDGKDVTGEDDGDGGVTGEDGGEGLKAPVQVQVQARPP